MIIPTIKIKITPEQLIKVGHAIDFDLPQLPIASEKKQTMLNYYSVLREVRIKLAKKVFSSVDKKSVTLTLKYHEAFTLLKTLEVVHRENTVQKIFDILHQKLT